MQALFAFCKPFLREALVALPLAEDKDRQKLLAWVGHLTRRFLLVH